MRSDSFSTPPAAPALAAVSAALDTLRTNPLFALELWTYQAYGYLMLNLVEDPAWLALVFC